MEGEEWPNVFEKGEKNVPRSFNAGKVHDADGYQIPLRPVSLHISCAKDHASSLATTSRRLPAARWKTKRLHDM